MGKLTKTDLEKMRSVRHNREGYKTSTKKTIKDKNGSNQVEHFDGRVDATIFPDAVKASSTAFLQEDKE